MGFSYSFAQKRGIVHTVEPRGNSNSEGERKTVRVIGVSFSEVWIKGKEI